LRTEVEVLGIEPRPEAPGKSLLGRGDSEYKQVGKRLVVADVERRPGRM
jgi:hypothetical protein